MLHSSTQFWSRDKTMCTWLIFSCWFQIWSLFFLFILEYFTHYAIKRKMLVINCIFQPFKLSYKGVMLWNQHQSMMMMIIMTYFFSDVSYYNEYYMKKWGLMDTKKSWICFRNSCSTKEWYSIFEFSSVDV